MLTNEEIEEFVKSNDKCAVCGVKVPEITWHMGIPNPNYINGSSALYYNIVSFCSHECLDGFEALLAE